jgi:hypothetical protein
MKGNYRATGDHSYHIPLVALAMLGHQRRRQLPARGTPVHQCPYHTLPVEPAMLAHQSHRVLEDQATHVRLRYLRQTPRQDLANDVRRVASSGTTRHARPPRASGAQARCKDRRIARWDRRGMTGWGRGVGVAGRRMGLDRAPRWSWPRWKERSRPSCDEHRQYRCLHRQCGVSAGGRSHRAR